MVMGVTIQIEDALFIRFKSLCESLDIAAGDIIEGIVSNALNDVMDGIISVFKKIVPGFQQGE